MEPSVWVVWQRMDTAVAEVQIGRCLRVSAVETMVVLVGVRAGGVTPRVPTHGPQAVPPGAGTGRSTGSATRKDLQRSRARRATGGPVFMLRTSGGGVVERRVFAVRGCASMGLATSGRVRVSTAEGAARVPI
eukprot:4214164-Lingulodinium_polyedra.AAC.1